MKVLKEQELLTYLIENTSFNRKKLKTLLKDGSILVNDNVITKYNYLLKKDDLVNINKYNRSDKIDIIYEDKDIIVVNKPANLLTISDGKNISLYELVSEYVKKNNKNNKIFVVHRLDRETSGIVLFAKNPKIKKIYQDNWNDIAILRKYVAIVVGQTKEHEVLKNYLKENANHFVYVSNNGSLAITKYQKISTHNGHTRLDINIKTGRKNQIRVQLSHNKTPILGDLKYGSYKYHRLCLHAYQLVIINPITHKEMIFNSNPDF